MINEKTASYGAGLLRVSLGVMFIAHAWLKISVFTPAGTAQYFASLGLPEALAYITIFMELVGGILLVAGFKTREVSLALLPILLGALFFGHAANGWAFSNSGGGWEYPLFLAMAALVQALLGDGAYSYRSLRSA